MICNYGLQLLVRGGYATYFVHDDLLRNAAEAVTRGVQIADGTDGPPCDPTPGHVRLHGSVGSLPDEVIPSNDNKPSPAKF